MAMRFRYRFALWSLAVLAALTALFFVLRSIAMYKARKTQARAELFLAQALQLEVGRATRSQVEQLAEQFGAEYYAPPWLVPSAPPAYPVPPPSPTAGMVEGCMGWSETFVFEFNNSALHDLGLAPLVRLRVGLWVYRGILCNRGVGFGSGTGLKTVVIDIHEWWPVPNTTRFQADLSPFATYIELTGPLPDDVRRGLYSFNFGCLSRAGGCRRSQDLLPWIWAQHGRKGVSFPRW